jgi:uncharacterized protein (UPF0548 family)
MFFLRRPSDPQIARLLAEQRELPFTYPDVGATRSGGRPRGYPLNHHRGRVGTGREGFERARAALRRWAMYDLPWTRLCPPGAPVRVGTVAGTLVRHFGFWSLNCVRIVYVLEEAGEVERSGFAIGTLPRHAERGEERFTVELHPDGSVWFEVFTFARGRGAIRAGAPLVRLLQRRFGRGAVEAMRRAVEEGAGRRG